MNTNPNSPYALGRVSGITRTKSVNTISLNLARNVDPFLKEIDEFGKLEGNFNNLPYQKAYDNNYFTNYGSDEIAHNYVNRIRHQSDETFKVKKSKVRKLSKLLNYDKS